MKPASSLPGLTPSAGADLALGADTRVRKCLCAAGVMDAHSKCSVNAHANSTQMGVCARLDSVWPAEGQGPAPRLFSSCPGPLDVTHCQALRGFSKPIL